LTSAAAATVDERRLCADGTLRNMIALMTRCKVAGFPLACFFAGDEKAIVCPQFKIKSVEQLPR
jgi:hypothetical protein